MPQPVSPLPSPARACALSPVSSTTPDAIPGSSPDSPGSPSEQSAQSTTGAPLTAAQFAAKIANALPGPAAHGACAAHALPAASRALNALFQLGYCKQYCRETMVTLNVRYSSDCSGGDAPAFALKAVKEACRRLCH